MNMNVDLKEVFYAMKYKAEEMIKENHGCVIINISSASVATGGSVMYGSNVAKLVVRKVSQTAAVELVNKGIQVNTVSPGSTETPLVIDIVDDIKNSGMVFSLDDCSTKSNVLGRNAQPADQANAILFLASDEASYITCQNINADGGWTVL